MLTISGILGIVGVPVAIYSFRDRQIEAEYGSKTVCYKCKAVIKPAKKKIVWASRRHKYTVDLTESCCEECKVEIETGSISTCAGCGKQLASYLRKIRVDPREKDDEGYDISETSHDYCDACKPKPTVLWGTFDTGRGYQWSKKFAPACPACRNEVQVGSTRCRCGQEFQWVNGTCTKCKGYGYLRCSQCNFTGKDTRRCGWCGGKGTYMGAALGNNVKCRDCNGTGETTRNCMWCNGEKRDKCTWCEGQGIVGGARKPWPH